MTEDEFRKLMKTIPGGYEDPVENALANVDVFEKTGLRYGNLTTEQVVAAIKKQRRENLAKSDLSDEEKLEAYEKYKLYQDPEKVDIGKWEDLPRVGNHIDFVKGALEKGISLDDYKKKVTEARMNWAGIVHNEAQNQVQDSRLFSQAVYEGDEDTQREILEKYKNDPMMTEQLKNMELSGAKKVINGASRVVDRYLAGGSVADKNSKDLAMGTGSTDVSFDDVRAGLADGVVAGVNALPMGRVATTAVKTAKVVNPIVRKAVAVGADGVLGAGTEVVRQAVAGEDIDLKKAGAAGAGNATANAVVGGGLNALNQFEVPGVNHLVNAYRKGSRADDMFVEGMEWNDVRKIADEFKNNYIPDETFSKANSNYFEQHGYELPYDADENVVKNLADEVNEDFKKAQLMTEKEARDISKYQNMLDAQEEVSKEIADNQAFYDKNAGNLSPAEARQNESEFNRLNEQSEKIANDIAKQKPKVQKYLDKSDNVKKIHTEYSEKLFHPDVKILNQSKPRKMLNKAEPPVKKTVAQRVAKDQVKEKQSEKEKRWSKGFYNWDEREEYNKWKQANLLVDKE